ncbi:MAG: hypothetical protein COX31_01585 [Candidatus Moranbacteria bacterium CG23_combo_of_CG06-09_8_20_14_all_40_16]|nr:MAG: hypothetical protein COX31_01585 [Candidatus Moranbacteria bacterium CG23_combo_of_CG06-09_8_20_14_all_40_16]
MKQCLIYDSSLRFSRATYGALVLIAFLLHNQWLVLVASILIILGIFSLKFNFPYQLHALISGKKFNPVQKELGELNFVAGATGALLLIGFLLIYFNRFINFAWAYLLIVDLMIFLACFVGFCVATLMYVFFKRLFNKNSIK